MWWTQFADNELSPQALLSQHHMVLYWETARGAETHTYDMPTLLALLADAGMAQDDARLATPMPFPPAQSRIIPFSTEWSNVEDYLQQDTGMEGNWGWYPIIIPKWPTLREDMTRHRVRSIMTLSRHWNERDAPAIEAPAAETHPTFEDDENVPPDLELNALLLSNDADPFPEMRTTIAHHYFDSTAQPHTLKRHMLADARMRSCLGAACSAIGYGGRCALWIEEIGERGDPEGTKPVMKLVTFPSYEDPSAPGRGRHPELADADCNVCTLEVPPGLDLDDAACLDLDDARGVVGIATREGDLWLLDYS